MKHRAWLHVVMATVSCATPAREALRLQAALGDRAATEDGFYWTIPHLCDEAHAALRVSCLRGVGHAAGGHIWFHDLL